MLKMNQCLKCGKKIRKPKAYCSNQHMQEFRAALAVAIRKEQETEGVDEDRWADDGGKVD